MAGQADPHPSPAGANERHVYLTPDEVEALARACPNPAAGDMCWLAAYTGLRRGELFALGRGNVVEGCLLLDAFTKTGACG